MSPVEALLKLLDHTDGTTLEILLDPEVLLGLIRRHEGLSDDAIRERLRTQAPGELLLGLFERGLTAPELMSSIDPELKSKVEAKIANAAQVQSRTKSDAPQKSLKPSGTTRKPGSVTTEDPLRQVVLLVVVIASGMIPAMAFILSLNVSLWILIHAKWVIATVFLVSGIAGGLLSREHRFWIAFLACGLASVGGGVAMAAYLFYGTQGRSSVLKIEIIIAYFAGFLPGLLLLPLGRRFFPKSSAAKADI